MAFDVGLKGIVDLKFDDRSLDKEIKELRKDLETVEQLDLDVDTKKVEDKFKQLEKKTQIEAATKGGAHGEVGELRKLRQQIGGLRGGRSRGRGGEGALGDLLGGIGLGGAAGGGGGGALSKILGGSAGGLAVAGGAIATVALGGAVGIGILKAVEKISEASPAFNKVMDMFGMAMKLFFRPVGDFVARILQPFALQWLQLGVKFNKIVKEKGLAVGIFEIGQDILKKMGENFGKALDGVFDTFGIETNFEKWIPDFQQTIWDFLGTIDWAKALNPVNWGDYIKPVKWAKWIGKLAWKAIVKGVKWTRWVGKLLWNKFIDLLKWTHKFIPKITWKDFIDLLKWATWVDDVKWPKWINPLKWPTFIKRNLKWSKFIKLLKWATWVDDVKWPKWINPLKWPKFIKKLKWVQWVKKKLTWGNFIDALNWLQYVQGGASGRLSWADWVVRPLKWVGDYLNKGASGKLKWPDWINPLNWLKYLVKKLNWNTYVDPLKWATWIFKKLTWNTFVDKLNWGYWIVRRLQWKFRVPKVNWRKWITGVNLKKLIPKFPGWKALTRGLFGGGGGGGGGGGSNTRRRNTSTDNETRISRPNYPVSSSQQDPEGGRVSSPNYVRVDVSGTKIVRGEEDQTKDDEEDSSSGGYNGPAAGFARGGIVTRPTKIMAGEIGDEAILPLDSLSNLLGDVQRRSLEGARVQNTQSANPRGDAADDVVALLESILRELQNTGDGNVYLDGEPVGDVLHRRKAKYETRREVTK